jgi:hypothetical protein
VMTLFVNVTEVHRGGGGVIHWVARFITHMLEASQQWYPCSKAHGHDLSASGADDGQPAVSASSAVASHACPRHPACANVISCTCGNSIRPGAQGAPMEAKRIATALWTKKSHRHRSVPPAWLHSGPG